jgi:hypothetical protein
MDQSEEQGRTHNAHQNEEDGSHGGPKASERMAALATIAWKKGLRCRGGPYSAFGEGRGPGAKNWTTMMMSGTLYGRSGRRVGGPGQRPLVKRRHRGEGVRCSAVALGPQRYGRSGDGQRW